uniref:Uncharacterized protein n=1 Tax=Oryza punctata TaxID=4537 RepID=A0A0E0KN13_ORYPU
MVLGTAGQRWRGAADGQCSGSWRRQVARLHQCGGMAYLGRSMSMSTGRVPFVDARILIEAKVEIKLRLLLLDSSWHEGKPGQNHMCKFPCMWLAPRSLRANSSFKS